MPALECVVVIVIRHDECNITIKRIKKLISISALKYNSFPYLTLDCTCVVAQEGVSKIMSMPSVLGALQEVA